MILRYKSKGATVGGAVSGDYKPAKCKTTFGPSSFPVKDPQIWITLPSEIQTWTDFKAFNAKAKLWFKQRQVCEHWDTWLHRAHILPFFVVLCRLQSLLFQSLFVVVVRLLVSLLVSVPVSECCTMCLSLKSWTRDKDCKISVAGSPSASVAFYLNVTISTCVVPVK